MGVSEGEQRKNDVDSLCEEIMATNFQNLRRNVHPHSKSSKDSNKEEAKEAYSKTHHQTVKSRTKKES